MERKNEKPVDLYPLKKPYLKKSQFNQVSFEKPISVKDPFKPYPMMNHKRIRSLKIN